MITITNPEIFGKTIAEALAAVNSNETRSRSDRMECINSIAKAAAKVEKRSLELGSAGAGPRCNRRS